MISLLFGRFSTAVKVAEALGIILAPAALLRCILAGGDLLACTLIASILAMYVFIRFCTTVRWYKDVPRYSGIELQFKKALVPTGYIMTICFALYLITVSSIFLIVGAFMMAVVAHVNVILLYFHYRDKDSTPVNFYTSGKFRDS